MEHALSFAIIAGLLGLTLLGALLLRQGFRVHASLETMRAALTAHPFGVSRTAGFPTSIARRMSTPHEVGSTDAASDTTEATERPPRELDDPLVTTPAFDNQGNPRPRWVPLSTLLRAVGIHPSADDPGLAVIAQAQCELRALAQLSTNLGTHEGEDMDFAYLGLALEGISDRLEVASDIFDPVQEVRWRKARRTTTEEPPAAAEPPPSDEPAARGHDV